MNFQKILILFSLFCVFFLNSVKSQQIYFDVEGTLHVDPKQGTSLNFGSDIQIPSFGTVQNTFSLLNGFSDATYNFQFFHLKDNKYQTISSSYPIQWTGATFYNVSNTLNLIVSTTNYGSNSGNSFIFQYDSVSGQFQNTSTLVGLGGFGTWVFIDFDSIQLLVKSNLYSSPTIPNHIIFQWSGTSWQQIQVLNQTSSWSGPLTFNYCPMTESSGKISRYALSCPTSGSTNEFFSWNGNYFSLQTNFFLNYVSTCIASSCFSDGENQYIAIMSMQYLYLFQYLGNNSWSPLHSIVITTGQYQIGALDWDVFMEPDINGIIRGYVVLGTYNIQVYGINSNGFVELQSIVYSNVYSVVSISYRGKRYLITATLTAETKVWRWNNRLKEFVYIYTLYNSGSNPGIETAYYDGTASTNQAWILSGNKVVWDLYQV